MKILVVNTTDKTDISAQFSQAVKERFANAKIVESFYTNTGNSADESNNLKQSDDSLQIIEAGSMEIKPCMGCNFCWLKTPGECAIKDDYIDVFKEYLKADKLFFITDTSFGFVSHKCKNAVDRLIPAVVMYLKFKNKERGHYMRYDKVPDVGFIYTGEGDEEYLSRWCDRMNLTFETKSLGVYSDSRIKEAVSCM